MDAPPKIMAVIGTGIDIVETRRIEDSIQRFGERFLTRCFSPEEIGYCQGMKFPSLHIAARFAAKEAISKAFGTGIGKQLGWRDMEIRKRDSGEPYAVMHAKGIQLAAARGVAEVLVTLAHCKDYAVAQAILVAAAQR